MDEPGTGIARSYVVELVGATSRFRGCMQGREGQSFLTFCLFPQSQGEEP